LGDGALFQRRNTEFHKNNKTMHDVPATPHRPMLTIFSEPCFMSSPFDISLLSRNGKQSVLNLRELGTTETTNRLK
jgi:hypothetical protein